MFARGTGLLRKLLDLPSLFVRWSGGRRHRSPGCLRRWLRLREFVEILVKHLDGRRAFADRRRDALHGAAANVSGGEQSGHKSAALRFDSSGFEGRQTGSQNRSAEPGIALTLGKKSPRITYETEGHRFESCRARSLEGVDSAQRWETLSPEGLWG